MDNTIQELHKRIAFLERENKELGKSLKMHQTAPEHVKDGDLKAAIEEFGKSVNFSMNSDVNRQKAAKMVHWLGKLAAYQDKTHITAEWLRNNGFEKHEVPWLERCLNTYIYSDDTLEIEAVLHDEERGIWEITITYYDESNTDQDVVYICTCGEFRMFLSIHQIEDILKA